LNLIRGRVPKSDVLSLVATVGAAIFHYDKIPDIQEADFVFLYDLLSFLTEFGIVREGVIKPVAEEVKARIHCKPGTFEKYFFEWEGQTQKEAFEKEAVKAAELAEKMHASKKKALERRELRRREQLAQEGNVEGQAAGAEQVPLGEELQSREPVIEDLQRLCHEERSLVHSLKSAGSTLVNWIALAGETFRNRLSRREYEKLAALWEQSEPQEDFHTPPGSPMHE
jgi:hypothetical protein